LLDVKSGGKYSYTVYFEEVSSLGLSVFAKYEIEFLSINCLIS